MNDRTVAMLESLKEDFYRGGGFIDIPAIEGAAEAIKKIRAAGYTFIIITARPKWQYKRVHGDTIEWLKKHGIEYDDIIFNKDKAEAIYERILPARPLFFIEDRAKHCLELANIGVKVLYLTRSYNENDIHPHPLIHRISAWDEVIRHMEESK
jgi:predicted urease superfamily metal-dependent hydrolase